MADAWDAAFPAKEHDPWNAAFPTTPTAPPEPSPRTNYLMRGSDISELEVPDAFYERLEKGRRFQRALERTVAPLKQAGIDFAEGFGNERLGLSPEHTQQLRELTGNSLFLNTVLEQGAVPIDAMLRAISGSVHAIGALTKYHTEDAENEFGISLGSNKARDETINFLNYALQRGDVRSSRLDYSMVPPPWAEPKTWPQALWLQSVREQPIGTLPTANDFRISRELATPKPQTARDFLGAQGWGKGSFVYRDPERWARAGGWINPEETATAVNDNLETLWRERGVHPAEALHDAQRDAFVMGDLTSANTPTADLSGIAHPIGSPVPQGSPRSSLGKTDDPLLDWVLSHPIVRRVIDNPEVVEGHDVPYTAGGSVPMRSPRFFIDKDFPRQFTIDGVTFDPADPFVIHENVEQFVMEHLIARGVDKQTAYRIAHFEFAEKAEGAWYTAHGIDKAKAEAAYQPYLEAIQRKHAGPSSGKSFEIIDKRSGEVVDSQLPQEDAFRITAGSDKYEMREGEGPPLREEDIGRALGLDEKLNIPPDLYKDPYPHDDPFAAAHEALEDAPPTAEEVAKARAILGEDMEANEAAPRALGADVTAALPDLATQPAPPPGRLVGAGRRAMDQFMGLLRNIQYLVDPMATGSNRAQVIAKDAISFVRRVHWEQERRQADLLRRFTPEQLERMWVAADEESVSLQLGEPPSAREHIGLATLTDEERLMVEVLQAHSQNAWLHAVDVGLVEGEGLPGYTPRMVLNVALAQEHGAPRALNELGRNVFTRTAQMLHREHLEAEETEAAARRMVEGQMRKRGATEAEIAEALEKVKVARNILALPLATARLEEATIWKQMINAVEETGKAAGEQTVVVGSRPAKGWFTIAGNPAFTKWEPAEFIQNEETGAWEPQRDQKGDIVFVPKPIYMPKEFEGPMRAILDESVNRGRIVEGAHSLYSALMGVKARSMTVILNSPLIHNEVVWSKVAEAAKGRELLGLNLYSRGNKIVYGTTGRAQELIERGLNPMGPRGAFQDITAMMEGVERERPMSWTGKLLSFIPGLFDERAGAATERAIEKAGDFVHNTLLWDRVRDLQFGIADHLSDRLVASGADRLTADRVAAHFSNILVGSIPKEAMSAGARATANMLLFSRSFTLGNLSTYKMAVAGLPKPILAQIERDFGMSAEEAIPAEAQATIKQTAQKMARKRAISTVMLSIGLYYIGNALIQHAMNLIVRGSNVNEELQGYARRYNDLMKDVEEDPFELRHLLGRLSPTYDNEPRKQDRAYIGRDRDGTGIYARNPTGKFGEELIGYPTHPMQMIKQKLSPMAGGLLDILHNDRGFGRHIYDENDTTITGDVKTAWNIAKYMVMKHLPEQQIHAAVDMLHGEGDPKVNRLRLLGPVFGFTASVGAPGGPARGEQLAVKQDFDAKFGLAWPDIKRQFQRGDIDAAREALHQLGTPWPMINGLQRNALNPSGALHGRTLQDFYRRATPAQIERFERAQRMP
jgi:hypothetical protein